MELNSIVFFIVSITYVSCSSWNYENQDQWPAQFCLDSVSQSPIDIETSYLRDLEEEPLKLHNWGRRQNGTILNNGHTVAVEIPASENIFVSGLGLPGKFQLQQFHFHWSSEHTIDGKRLALEAHFVTQNTQFRSLGDAARYSNGVAVIGILYELSRDDNMVLQPIVDQLRTARNAKARSSTMIKLEDFLPQDKSRFYRYMGSLTTPNCNDGVIWTIFQQTSTVSKKQIDLFSSIKGDDGKRLARNYRDIQPLNGREVFNVRADC